MGLCDADISGVIDTDPLVTMPVAHYWTKAEALPVIPSLAEQILLASASHRGPSAPTGRPKNPSPGALPFSDGDCAHVVRAYLLAQLPNGVESADLWRWLCRAHAERRWSRSVLQSALRKLARIDAITNTPGTANRRLLRAVPLAGKAG